jgi:hypothetical protein
MVFVWIYATHVQNSSPLYEMARYILKAEWKYEIQCPLLFKLDPARCYLRRHMKARGFEIARQFIDLYYLSSLEK